MMKIPEVIYLQRDGDYNDHHERLSDCTWFTVRLKETDIKYVRADLVKDWTTENDT